MMMLKNLFSVKILLIGCFLLVQQTSYQQNAEVRLLKAINPTNPTSGFWKFTTNSAKPVSFGLPIVLFSAGLITKDKDLQIDGAETLATLGITTVITLGIKNIVNRPRPYQTYTDIYPDHLQAGRSFPSGHTSVAFGTATSLSMLHKEWYFVVPSYAWATAVGYSRLYLGQHYPTDILGAAVAGAGSAWISHKGTNWLRKSNKFKKKAP